MIESNYNQNYQSAQERPEKTLADPWVHRSDGMRCKTCLWFVSKQPQIMTVTVKSHEVGRCRRHAPTMGGYPVVYMTDWCGDHRIDENKV
jgi:hypothetical protein